MSDLAPGAEDTPKVEEAPEDKKPVVTETEDTDYKAEAEKWKNLSRKNEDTAKANAESARLYQEYLDSKKTDDERASEAQTKLQRERDDAQAELAKARAALKHGLTDEDLELLGSGTAEEIETRAAKLALRLKAARPDATKDPHLGREKGVKGGGSGDWLRDLVNNKS